MVKEQIKRETIKCFQLNENENTIYQNLLDTIKAVLGGRGLGGVDYRTKLRIRKEERSAL